MNPMMKKVLLVVAIAIILCIAVLVIIKVLGKGENENMGYQQITMDEAKGIFEQPGDYIILDVRTFEEYNDGHIPGAICIPNENIGSEPLEELPDKDQLIYVYCRSGNRSKKAAQKLVDMGYTNIVEFGGIINWKGEKVTS